jgi:Fic family protein
MMKRDLYAHIVTEEQTARGIEERRAQLEALAATEKETTYSEAATIASPFDSMSASDAHRILFGIGNCTD